MTVVSLTVNGKPVSEEIEDRTLLVYFLRDRLGLTGTHIGCDTSQCGACVVHVDGARGEVLLHVRAPGPGRRRHHHRGPRPGTASCTRCRRRSARTTACNAASARRA